VTVVVVVIVVVIVIVAGGAHKYLVTPWNSAINCRNSHSSAAKVSSMPGQDTSSGRPGT